MPSMSGPKSRQQLDNQKYTASWKDCFNNKLREDGMQRRQSEKEWGLQDWVPYPREWVPYEMNVLAEHAGV